MAFRDERRYHSLLFERSVTKKIVGASLAAPELEHTKKPPRSESIEAVIKNISEGLVVLKRDQAPE